MISEGRQQFQLGYQISPIILVNSIAANTPGKMLPIVNLTDADNLQDGTLLGVSLDQYFAH